MLECTKESLRLLKEWGEKLGSPDQLVNAQLAGKNMLIIYETIKTLREEIKTEMLRVSRRKSC